MAKLKFKLVQEADMTIAQLRQMYAMIEEGEELEHPIINLDDAACWVTDEKTRLVVALHEGDVVGYICFSDCLETETADVLLNTVEVLPDYRGTGLGRRLVRTCLTYADKKGVPVSLLYSLANDAQYGLRAFYESEGFKLVAMVPHTYDFGVFMCYMKRMEK